MTDAVSAREAARILGRIGRGKAKARHPDVCRKAQRASVEARRMNRANAQCQTRRENDGGGE